MSAPLDISREPIPTMQERLLSLTHEQPSDVLAWLLLGWTAVSAEQASQYFQHALKIQPGNALAQDGLDRVQCGSWRAVEIQQINWQNLDKDGDLASFGLDGRDVKKSKQSTLLAATQEEVDQIGMLADLGEAALEEGAARAPSQVAVPAIATELGTTKEKNGSAWRSMFLVACLYLAGITLAEWLTILFDPVIGLVVHSLILVGLLLHSAISHQRNRQRMLITLSLAPLIRLVSLSLPLTDYVFYVWYFIVGVPLLLAAFMVIRYCGYRLSEIGMRLTSLPLQLVVGTTGIGLGYLEYNILHPQPLTQSFNLDQIWLPALILVIFTGFLEEIIFRGLMQNAFIAGLGKWRGLVYVSTVFAVLHLGYNSAIDVFFVFSVALFFGWVTLRTGTIWGVTLAHGLTNVSLFLIFPFILG